MSPRYDLVVVGMGSGGIVAAELAARIGWRVAAVERSRIGGDCLWTGCVPSKALLASAKVAHAMRTADRYGLQPVEPAVDTGRVWARIRDIQAEIARNDDNPERFEAIGAEVLFGTARLVGPHEVDVEGRRLTTRYVLIATGSRPALPPIPGLAEAGYLTSETIFAAERAPDSVVVIGGGPVGVELAQALGRLGTAVTLLQRSERLLRRDEPGLVARLTAVLRRDGVVVHTRADIEGVAVEDGRKVVSAQVAGVADRFEADEILVAAGRTPNVDDLDLTSVGVRAGPRGVGVDRRLRTSARSIYAAGDVAGRYRFTHSAAHEAAIAVRNMAFPGWTNAPDLIPWCTFTDPELAHVGLTEEEARSRHGASGVGVRRLALARSDRARADGATDGELLVVEARGKVVGAHLLAPAAGEAIHELARLVSDRRKLRDAARLVHVYPTISTSIATLAGERGLELAERLGWLARLPGPGRLSR